MLLENGYRRFDECSNMTTDRAPLWAVVYEGEGASRLSSGDRFSVIGALLERGYGVKRREHGSFLADDSPAGTLVLGRFDQGKPEIPAGCRIRDIGGLAPEQVADVVDVVRDEVSAARPGQWKPWFPVIDYDRCTNCMQCLSFCLFGVYGVDRESRLQVQNQDNCKTNCPACSRVCPEAAIMFPKYKAGPINGDVVSDTDLQREKMKVDISALLGGDVYEMLRLRSEKARSRFSKERDSDKALSERQRCLTKLAEAGDIPAEVLLSLPSPEEIARRAEEAKAKAAAALEARSSY
jgi:Pyruvate/2-oxoacid:ferredoxin oxidoreductase delta subunit